MSIENTGWHEWIITAASIAGVILNVYKIKYCFVIWSLTNLIWAAINFAEHHNARAALFGFYLCVSLWGLYKWSAEANAKLDHEGSKL